MVQSPRLNHSTPINNLMILLNFGHPLNDNQLAAIRQATGQADWDLRDVKTQFDHERPFPPQITALVNSLEIDSSTWQTKPILVNPPTHHLIAVSLLAELNGRMGYFPAVIRLKPVPGSLPPRFELAEIVNLQAIRDEARSRR